MTSRYFPTAGIAAGACSGNGILFDISDPLKPKRIDAVVDTALPTGTRRRSTTTARKVIFTDEWGGGSRPRCRAYDPITWGADAIYDLVDGKLDVSQLFQDACAAVGRGKLRGAQRLDRAGSGP